MSIILAAIGECSKDFLPHSIVFYYFTKLKRESVFEDECTILYGKDKCFVTKR